MRVLHATKTMAYRTRQPRTTDISGATPQRLSFSFGSVVPISSSSNQKNNCARSPNPMLLSMESLMVLSSCLFTRQICAFFHFFAPLFSPGCFVEPGLKTDKKVRSSQNVQDLPQQDIHSHARREVHTASTIYANINWFRRKWFQNASTQKHTRALTPLYRCRAC